MGIGVEISVFQHLFDNQAGRIAGDLVAVIASSDQRSLVVDLDAPQTLLDHHAARCKLPVNLWRVERRLLGEVLTKAVGVAPLAAIVKLAAQRFAAAAPLMKFLCDAERCIECNGCVTACKQEHDIPWGVNRRRVVTINDGVPGERSISVACMHCSDAACVTACPTGALYHTEFGTVGLNHDRCIGCTRCAQDCPADAIPIAPYQRHQIDTEKCIRCDTCRQVCPYDAVDVK